MNTHLTALALTLAMGLGSAPAWAYTYAQAGTDAEQPSGIGEPEQQPYGAYSDEELQQFVDLQDEIGDIRQEYVARIETAETDDEARELQQEAQNAMIDAINEAGMTVEDYNAIAVAYNSDPSVRERIDEMADGLH